MAYEDTLSDSETSQIQYSLEQERELTNENRSYLISDSTSSGRMQPAAPLRNGLTYNWDCIPNRQYHQGKNEVFLPVLKRTSEFYARTTPKQT